MATIPEGSSESPVMLLPDIKFHATHADNIDISENNLGAVLKDARNFPPRGLVFSHRPIKLNEKIFFRFTDLNDSEDSIVLGLTHHDPATLTTERHANAIRELIQKPGYWLELLRPEFCAKGHILIFHVDTRGKCMIKVHRKDLSSELSYQVDISRPLWLIMEIRGYGTNVQFPPRRTLATPTQTVSESTPLIPLKLHRVGGKNVKMVPDMPGMAYRDINTVNHGYIFSAHPMRPGQKILIKIWNTETVLSGSMAVGITSCDPAKIEKLPGSTAMLLCRPEYWHVVVNLANGCKKGDEISIYRSQGKICVSVNGTRKELRAKPPQRIWLFVNIYGATRLIRLWTTQENTGTTSHAGGQGTIQATPTTPRLQDYQQEPFGSGQNSQISRHNMTATLPPLSFHSTHSDNIRILRDSSTAALYDRKGILSYMTPYGLTFTSRPVRLYEKVYIHILESPPSSGTIFIGFTNRDPSTIGSMRNSEVILHLGDKGFWAENLKEELCLKNNILAFHVDSSGKVHLTVNGQQNRIFSLKVNTTGPLWGIMELWGIGTVAELPKDPSKSRAYNRSEDDLQIEIEQSTYAVETECVPSNLHMTKGRNIETSDILGVATRKPNTTNQGYVFLPEPLRPRQIVSVLILNKERKPGSLGIGITSCDPSTLNPTDLPDNSERLLDRSEYWRLKTNIAGDLQKGDDIRVSLNSTGGVNFCINAIMHELAIDHPEKIWLFLDIYGSTQSIRVYSTEKRRPITDFEELDIFPETIEANTNDEGNMAAGLQNLSLPGNDEVQQNIPPLRQQNIPSTSQQNVPTSSRQNIPTTSEQNIPTSNQQNIPTSRQQNIQTSNQQNVPTSSQQPAANSPPPTQVIVTESKKECTICYEREINCVLYKCGHMHTCYECALQLWERSGRCPICRQKIESVIKTYQP